MPGALSTYQVLRREAPKQASDHIVAGVAESIRGTVAAASPRGRTGTYASSWRVQKIKAGVYMVLNPTRYGKYIEYGTRYVAARPVLGRTISQYRARLSR